MSRVTCCHTPIKSDLQKILCYTFSEQIQNQTGVTNIFSDLEIKYFPRFCVSKFLLSDSLTISDKLKQLRSYEHRICCVLYKPQDGNFNLPP